jgi:hypothetical protein
MGLLDDAIREHLELKRRRGADPGEVAREQREALDVAPEASAESLTGEPEPLPQQVAQVPVDASPGMAEPDQAGSTSDGEIGSDQPEQAAALGETAELDMSSVLGAGASGHSDAPPASPAEEDSLEWEVPGEAAEDEPEEQAEDVLEATPEFLRDTPEEDRLWFEQRPPRDFDFDK